jgi:YjbE family integral membrane protein
LPLPFEPSDLWALLSVVVIDVVLAGDNAIVVGMAAAGLPRQRRRRVIAVGIAIATVLRVLLSMVAMQLLAIIGLTLAGGVLLLWVAWKFYRELRPGGEPRAERAAPGEDPPKGFGSALLKIVLADVSMSLDNVLAVAGTARDNWWVLGVGLLLSVALMGAASTLVARLLDRYRWIAWLGLGLVTFVALRMIYDGSAEVWTHAIAPDGPPLAPF